MPFQAVVLAGGAQKRMYPLTLGCVKALLPVANKPLLSYPMKMLEDAGVKSVIVVVVVSEDSGTAEALKAAAPKITSDVFVVTTGDLVSDVSLRAVVLQHQVNEALATVLLTKRKTSPASETKPGKPPKAVDYIGVDESQTKLLFHASSAETLNDLKMPLAMIRKHGRIDVRTNLLDAHLYVFSRAVLGILVASPVPIPSVKYDLIPLLIKHQLLTSSGAAQRTPAATSAALKSPRPSSHDDGQGEDEPLPGASYEQMAHWATDIRSRQGHVEVHMAPDGCYCGRVNNVDAYGDVNREVATPEVWQSLTGVKPSAAGDNVLPASVTIANKATVGPGCMLGENTTVGDKSSIKRSVIGSNCRLGQSVKVINSVLMDGVVVDAGTTIQNSIICAAAHIQERCSLKDCQVGPGYVVSEGVDVKGEVLARKPEHSSSVGR